MSFCQNCILPSDSEENRDGADAEFLFPLFFSFSVSFKNSSLSEKVGKLVNIVFVLLLVGPVSVSIIVAKYNIFPRADNGRSREKRKNFWRSYLLTPSASTIGILSTLKADLHGTTLSHTTGLQQACDMS